MSEGIELSTPSAHDGSEVWSGSVTYDAFTFRPNQAESSHWFAFSAQSLVPL